MSGRLGSMVLVAAIVAACGDDGAAGDQAGGAETSAVDRSSPSTEEPHSTSSTSTTVESSQAWTTVTVVDPSRPTDEITDAEGAVLLPAADERTIPVNLLYDGDGDGGPDATAAQVEPKPIAVVLHGLGGTEEPGNPLPQRLHRAGYVVIMPNQQETSAPVNSIVGYPLLPGDTTAVLDALLDPADGVADDLATQLDGERIAIIGHSIGATGALAMAFHECCTDSRVDAVATFGASDNFALGDSPWDFTAPVPKLVIHGTEDQISSVEEASEILDASGPEARLLLVEDADHLQPVYGNDQPEFAESAHDALVAFLAVHLDRAPPETLDPFGLVSNGS